MKRTDIVKEARFIHVAVSACFLLAGLFIMVVPEEITTAAARWIIGAGFVVMGIARLLGYFANDLYRLAFQYDMAIGAFLIILGTLIFIYPKEIWSVLPLAVGFYVVLDALLKFQTAFDARAFGMKHWWGLLTAAVLLLASGVAVLLTCVRWELVWPVGLALLLDGGENVWNTMGTVRIRAKKNEKFENLL